MIYRSGFDTKDEAIKAGNIAYTEYLNTGLVFKEKEISFSDYLNYWYDIDFKNRVINVKHTVYDKPDDGKGRWYIGTTKTKQGIRPINMSITLYNALLNYRKKQQYLKNVFGSEYYTYGASKFTSSLNYSLKINKFRKIQDN